MFDINGLLYIPQFINENQHDKLIQTIDTQLWREDLSRRTQHYGYIYDYRTKKIDISMQIGGLPVWLESVANQLHKDGLFSTVPDQAIINEYMPGQGIADHIDCIPCFDDTIASLSLATDVVMNLKYKDQTISFLLEPRSILILRGDARYKWTHGIARRKSDIFGSKKLKRERRLSITFRKVILNN